MKLKNQGKIYNLVGVNKYPLYKNFVTNVLSSFPYIKLETIGNREQGFTTEELNAAFSNSEAEYYNIFIDAHGTGDRNGHFTELDKPTDTGKFFGALNSAVKNKPLNIVMVSCYGKYAQNYLQELPKGSVLITFSGHNTTNSSDFTFPSNEWIKTFRDTFEESYKNKEFNRYSLIKFLSEIYCLNQRCNAFEPRIGVHTKDGKAVVHKIGNYANDMANGLTEFSPIFEALFKNSILEKKHTQGLVKKIKNNQLNIKEAAPKFPFLTLLEKLNTDGPDSLLESIYDKLYSANNFKAEHFTELLSCIDNPNYKNFAELLGAKSLAEIKDLIINTNNNHIPKTIAARNLIKNSINADEKLYTNLVDTYSKEQIKNCGIEFEVSELDNFEKIKSNQKGNALLKAYCSLMKNEKELALYQALGQIIVDDNEAFLNFKKATEDRDKAQAIYIESCKKAKELTLQINYEELEKQLSQTHKTLTEAHTKVQLGLLALLEEKFGEVQLSKYVYKKDVGGWLKARTVKDILIGALNKVLDMAILGGLDNYASEDPKQAIKDYISAEKTAFTSRVFTDRTNSLYDANNVNHIISNHNVLLGLVNEYFFDEVISDLNGC